MKRTPIRGAHALQTAAGGRSSPDAFFSSLPLFLPRACVLRIAPPSVRLHTRSTSKHETSQSEEERSIKDWQQEARELREEIRQLKETVRLLQGAKDAGGPARAKKPRIANGHTLGSSSIANLTTPPTQEPGVPPSADRVKNDMKEMVKRMRLALRGPDTIVGPSLNWAERIKEVLKKDPAWLDRFIGKKLPSEKDWNRLIEQTKYLPKEPKELKMKQWLADHKTVSWFRTTLERLNTVNPKMEWEQVRARLNVIPPGILSLNYVERLRHLELKTQEALPQLQKDLEWVAKVATRLAKTQAKPPKVSLPEVVAPTKYPIVLAHGLGGDKPFLKCFLGIPEDLKPLGVPVYTPKVARYGTVYARAETLKEQILRVLEETRAPKVNIIGHSMGGLDARHFISNLGGHEVTASLITLGTPHRGSAYSDWVIAKTDAIGLERLFRAQILPFPMEGHHQVTPKFMKEVFNPQTPDHPDVAYFSMAGTKKISPSHPLFICQRILSRYEGTENDGLVSVESAKWGEYLETLDIDHAAMINWSYRYDARVLYRRLVNLLHEKGF